MDLKQKTTDLKKRMRDALKGGGDKAIEKQKAIGKMTARERIIALLDPKSFHEYDLFVEHAAKDFDMDKKWLPGDGVITGTGTIYGHPVCIYAQDFTVAGGSLGLYGIGLIIGPCELRKTGSKTGSSPKTLMVSMR